MTTSEARPTDSPPRLVVGVDGSSASLKGLHWALDYASATQSKVDVVIAWDWPASLAWSGPFPSDFDPNMSAQQMLDLLITRERSKYPNLAVEGRAVQGDPANVLESASHGASLLVVGQSGHGELVGLLLGSVSEHCVTHAHCPVLVFREDQCGTPTGASS